MLPPWLHTPLGRLCRSGHAAGLASAARHASAQLVLHRDSLNPKDQAVLKETQDHGGCRWQRYRKEMKGMNSFSRAWYCSEHPRVAGA